MKEDLRTRLGRRVGCGNPFLREFLAEFLGSIVLIAMGNGSVAQSVLSNGANGTFLSINVAYGLAVTLAVFISGGVSGGHVNPAITLAMCILGKTKWRQLPIYFAAQYLGCMFGSLLVYVIYIDAIDHFDGGKRIVVGENATAGIFATYPAEYASSATLFYDQVFGTAILALSVLAITDERNVGLSRAMVPMAVGLVVLVIGTSYGMNCGYAINPARDLAPRFFTWLSGWGSEVFSHRNFNWFWIPVIGPHVGAILGAFLYEAFVGLHWPRHENGDFPGRNGEITLSDFKKTEKPIA